MLDIKFSQDISFNETKEKDKTIKELIEKIINLNNSIKMLENNNKILLNNKKDNDKNITDLTNQINILDLIMNNSIKELLIWKDLIMKKKILYKI